MADRDRSWGRITALPHEHLIQLRQGRVVRSQQGGTCFAWPGDCVARIDTSVHRLQFTADQVTREKVGVGVTGLAVFRIVEPLLAYRMLDLGDRGAYERILEEMFVGATRRLVANLSLEECITRRKDALAAELTAEVAPVVEGRGAALAWTSVVRIGEALYTIEVQDVRVPSEEVFSRLQAPYREELALQALQARAEVEAEEARLAAQAAQRREERRRELMALEEERLAAERERAERQVRHDAHLAGLEQASRLEREGDAATARVEMARRDAQAQRATGQAEVELEASRREAALVTSPERLQELLLTQTLPAVAGAFRDSYDQVVVTGGEMSFLGSGLAQVLAVANGLGVELPWKKD